MTCNCPHCQREIPPSLLRQWINGLFKLPTTPILMPCEVCGHLLSAREAKQPCPKCGKNNWKHAKEEAEKRREERNAY